MVLEVDAKAIRASSLKSFSRTPAGFASEDRVHGHARQRFGFYIRLNSAGSLSTYGQRPELRTEGHPVPIFSSRLKRSLKMQSGQELVGHP